MPPKVCQTVPPTSPITKSIKSLNILHQFLIVPRPKPPPASSIILQGHGSLSIFYIFFIDFSWNWNWYEMGPELGKRVT